MPSRAALAFASPALLENLLRIAVLLLALLCLAATHLQACGPDFPNNLLDSGDYAVLVAPSVRFGEELERMHLVQTRWQAVFTTNGYPQEAADAEITDLTVALRRAKTSSDEIARIISAHRVQRERLHKYVADYERWHASGRTVWDANGEGHQMDPIGDPPMLPAIVLPPGLPDEFADYFLGTCECRNPVVADKHKARAAWEKLLARPTAERKFKSTWAAYMLGKSWENKEPEKAVEYFQQARDLAKQGFVDSVGLATASLGREARVHLNQHRYQQAIHLYLEQLAAGDSSAIESLSQTADAALGDAKALQRLAKDSRSQKVITAKLISRRGASWTGHYAEAEGSNASSTGWLQAVEIAGVEDVDSAEKLALAAYQGGAFETAERWIKRAPGSPLAQWLQAKLWLRAGKVGPAAALLARLSHSFPLEPKGTNTPTSLIDNLVVPFSQDYREEHGVGAQLLGELGVLRLHRHQYAESLDALVRSGFWMDAAYVAERVLTLDELKAYVDSNWPSPEARTNEVAQSGIPTTLSPRPLGEDIRYLLARRLARASRGAEARDYYPPQWRLKFDELMAELTPGWDETQPANRRASSLFAGAWIARTNGLELLGTETGPDWFVHRGDFEYGVTGDVRTNESFKILGASPDELRRAFAHNADPEVRWHYRYQAAFLAWEAAKLMPNDSDDTAFVLWTAGDWLKNRDPVTADGFYKTLVRRCRKTCIGAEADRIRWFPQLDEHRQVIRRETNQAEAPQVLPSDVLPAANDAVEALEGLPFDTPAEVQSETDGDGVP